MEEFALCWNKLKFAENLSSGFQSLFDRGDFVDCTIACDGQLLQCHKLVLAICSPYFREIFMNNPCRHPIIILKDVTFSIMSELLQFMYQGEVNVKQAELQSFMSIAESLQIKGLATNSGSSNSNNGTNNNNNNNSTSNGNNSTMRSSDALNSSYSQFHSNNVSGGGGGSTANNTGVHRNHNQHQFNSAGNHTENHRQTTSTPLSTTSSIDCGNHAIKGGKHMSGESSTPQTATPSSSSSSFAQKRTIDQISEQQQHRQSQMKMKRTVHDVSDSDMNDSIDNMTSDDIFLPTSMQPQVTINESPRFDANSVKRENSNDVIRPQSPGNVYRNSYHSSNSMQNTSFPYFPDFSPSDLSNSNNINDLSKSHMEVPPGTHNTSLSNVTMLSATSLLHNSMIFNRNNTVATQQGMKTYWLCRSYRLTTCRARCITHQGQLISTTGQHNHPPHVKGGATSTSTTQAVMVTSNNFKMEDTSGTFGHQQQMSNQMQGLSSSANLTMINQQQQQQQCMNNFAIPTNNNNSSSSTNFNMSNILSPTLSDIDPILMHTANQLDSNIQITPIINASIDDLHMNPLSSDITIHDTSNIHNIAITTANN